MRRLSDSDRGCVSNDIPAPGRTGFNNNGTAGFREPTDKFLIKGGTESQCRTGLPDWKPR